MELLIVRFIELIGNANGYRIKEKRGSYYKNNPALQLKKTGRKHKNLYAETPQKTDRPARDPAAPTRQPKHPLLGLYYIFTLITCLPRYIPFEGLTLCDIQIEPSVGSFANWGSS